MNNINRSIIIIIITIITITIATSRRYIHLSIVWQLLRLLRPKLQPQELLISCCELHA